MAESKKDIYLKRDRMLRAITQDGEFRAVLIKATDTVNTAVSKHELNPLASVLLGELLVAALISTVSMKGEERIVLRLDVDGPIRFAVAEANGAGEVRGYLGEANPVPEGDEPGQMKKNAIGKGLLSITKYLHKNAKPVTSSIEVVESLIVKEIARYFAVSEQVPTAIKIDVQFNEDFTIKHAFGLLLQSMPGADPDSVLELENDIIDHPNLGELFEKEEDLDQMLSSFLKGKTWSRLDKTPVDFFCRCGKDRFVRGLHLLGLEDLKGLADREQELVCQYCNAKYYVSVSEIEKIIKEKEETLPKKKN